MRFELPVESGDALEDNCAVSSRARSKRVTLAESLPHEEEEEEDEEEEEEEEGDDEERAVDAKHRQQVLSRD